MNGGGVRPFVWWLSPGGGILLLVPLTLATAFLFDDAHYRIAWGTQKALTPSSSLLFATGALVLVLGTMLTREANANIRSWPSISPGRELHLQKASTALFRATMLGYLALGTIGLSRGASVQSVLQAILTQNVYGSPLKQQFAYVAGVTSLTQIGIAYVVVATLLLINSGPRLHHILGIALVLNLAALRAYLLSERLALLELLVPAITLLGTALVAGGRHKGLVQGAPLVLLPLVLITFGALEYFRSWVFYSGQGGSGESFASFVLNRLAGYYATAYNNGQLIREHAAMQPPVPYQSIEAFWTAPGVSAIDLYATLTGRPQPVVFAEVLAQYGNPEFNSPGGLAVPFIDYGILGGFAYFLLVGLILGSAYRAFLSSQSWGLLLYPVLVTGVFELPRYLYWGQGRVLPAILALLLVHWTYETRSKGAVASR